MKTKLTHGAELEALTPAEAEVILRKMRNEERTLRIRATAIVALDANGAGQDEAYTVPLGFEFEARRVTLDLDTATDPNTGAVSLTNAGTGDAVGAAGHADAPGGGTVIAATGALTAGVYDVFVTTYGASLGNPDVTNLQLRHGTTVVGAPLMQLAAIPNQEFRRVTVVTGETLNVIAVAAAGVGSSYNVGITAVKVTDPTIVRAVEFLRSGTRVEYAAPSGPGGMQIPGVQTWGMEQGPYLQNGETFEIRARGLTANSRLSAIVEGVLRRPPVKA